MKIILFALCCTSCLVLNAQSNPKNYFDFKDTKKLVFADDFDTDREEWHILENDRSDTIYKCDEKVDSIDKISGVLHCSNSCKRGDGRIAKIDIDYNKNFEIILVAKVVFNENDIQYSEGYLNWNINDSSNQYNAFFFTGFYNSFHDHYGFDTTADECIGARKHLKKSKNIFNEFARYTIRKYDDKYFVFVNGVLKGTFPFIKFNGSNIALGARANSKVEFDHVSIYYLL